MAHAEPFQDLMVHKIVGPGGQVVIAPDRKLTALTKDAKPYPSAY